MVGCNSSKRKDKFEFLRGSGSIKIGNIKPQSYKLMINAKENSQIIINTRIFPGYLLLMVKEGSR